MTGSGGDVPLPSGGEFLLSLLQKPQPRHQQQPSPLETPILMPQPQPQAQAQPPQQQSLPMDPAVAAVGPTLPFPPLWPSNVLDLPSPWPHAFSPPLTPNFLGFPQNPWSSPASQFTSSQGALIEDLRRIGFSEIGNNNNQVIPNLIQSRHQEQKLLFGSLPSDIHLQKHQEQTPGSLSNGNLPDNSKLNLSNQPLDSQVNAILNSRQSSFQRRIPGDRGKQQQRLSNYRSTQETRRRLPPGFSEKPRGSDFGRIPPGFPEKPRGSDFGKRIHFEPNVYKVKAENSRLTRDNGEGLTEQLDHPGPPSGSNLLSVSATDIEESLSELHSDGGRHDNIWSVVDGGVNEVEEQLLDLLIEDESDNKNGKKQFHREKESRIDNRGHRLLSQRMRMLKRQMECRSDIHRLNAPFLAIYESLIPPEEERTKQKQFLALLEKLVCKEWPEARLYLYGSCANTFGVSKSDIDVCLAFNEDVDKAEILLKLADILQSDNLQNVQALTRARVPIVKLMDPTTGISCDICINNVLAVVNTKLLRDYGKIDGRLRQLAFIVKHWAKSRGVNETYQGTLSSYAYVLMCIHFLQQRRPAILPCLQGMEKTYSVTVDDVECAFFDQVEKLRNFGSSNRETVSQLVWAFFNYWAYGHDYSNSVISVRTGSIISKREKDWTRRIGNDRHLICIEDPFETSHDLGRVVDKFSIRVLREEFERAAEVMQYDPNPCVTLFQPYVPS